MLEETLVELIEFVKAIAPEVWAIYVKQVYVEAGQTFVLFVIAAVITIGLGRYIKWMRSDDGYGDPEIPMVIAVITGIFGTVFLTMILGRLINPEYYALQYILNLLP